ncbi:MAG: hypothetical protein LH624_02615 [Cryobacterium sp.]|nr:hypothetical protein [Cryobacterium sp.]
MDKNRLWVIGSVLVMGAILALGFVLGIQPQLESASAAQSERLVVETTNAEQAVVLAQLKEDFASIDEVRQALAPLTISVPTGTEMPAFVNQLSELAGQSQVSLTGITVSEPQAYATVEAPAEAVPVASVAAGDAAPTDAAVAAPVAAAPAATAGVPPVVDSRITATNFASLSVQISITGDYSRVLDFVNGLQTGSRLFLVSGITTATVAAEGGAEGTAPVAGGPVDATITGLVYVLIPDGAAGAVVAAG